MFFTAPQNTIKEQKKTTETKLETRWNFFRHKLRQEKSFRVIFFNTGHTNIVFCPYPPYPPPPPPPPPRTALTNYEKILPSNNLSQNKTLPLAIIGRANACYSFMVPSVPFSTPLLPRQFDSKCQQYYNFSFWPSHQHQPIYQAVYGDLS